MPANLKRAHVSYSHTEAQVEKTLEACEGVLKEMFG
jgi:glutamate-1-semialdehyde aminotransferase